MNHFPQNSFSRPVNQFPQNTKPHFSFNPNQPGILGKPHFPAAQNKWYSKPNNFGTNERPICQICFKIGHEAQICYHRTNLDYKPQPPSHGHNKNQKSVAAFLASSVMPTPAVVADNSWYMDSGASHHLTSDVSNLNPVMPFQGVEQVMVGDGSNIEDHSTTRPS